MDFKYNNGKISYLTDGARARREQNKQVPPPPPQAPMMQELMAQQNEIM
jgi:hypothetical protein